MLVTPQYLFASVSRITPEFLRRQGVSALVLDVDDTLTAHGSQELEEEVARWLADLRQAGVRLAIVSNNTKGRVAPFAGRLGLDFISFACKPLPAGLARARRRFGVPKSRLAIVGDQLFTDRLAASLYGIRAYIVRPRGGGPSRVRFKRWLEKPFMSRYFKKGGRLL